METTQTYIYSTDIVSLAAAGSSGSSVQENIDFDKNISFTASAIHAVCTDANCEVFIEYNSEDKLMNKAVKLKNIAVINGVGDAKIFPLTINYNGSMRIQIANKSTSANEVQLSFIGKRTRSM